MVVEWIIENWLLSAGIVILVVYAIGDHIKKKRMQKEKEAYNKRLKEEEEEAMQEEHTEEEPITLETNEKVPFQSYFKMPGTKKDKAPEETLKDYSKDIIETRKAMEDKIKKEKETIQKELADTKKKREDIQKQGMALAELYDRMIEREQQLETLLQQ